MSKIDRVDPAGARFGSTPGGGGRPSDSRRFVPNVVVSAVDCRNGGVLRFFGGGAPGGGGRPSDSRRFVPNVVVSAVDCRNGGFCAFDEDVPPGVKFQNMPK